MAAAAPPQPSVVSAPPQPSYHAQLAQARAQPASSYYPQQAQGSPEPLPGDDTNPTKLFVGGLSMVTCKEDLQEYLGASAPCTTRLSKSTRMTKQSRGFGFVTVAPRKAADVLGPKTRRAREAWRFQYVTITVLLSAFCSNRHIATRTTSRASQNCLTAAADLALPAPETEVHMDLERLFDPGSRRVAESCPPSPNCK